MRLQRKGSTRQRILHATFDPPILGDRSVRQRDKARPNRRLRARHDESVPLAQLRDRECSEGHASHRAPAPKQKKRSLKWQYDSHGVRHKQRHRE